MAKKKIVKKKISHEIVVKVQPVSAETTVKDIEAIKDGGKYMIPKTWMSERQVVKLVQKTPPQHIYRRPGKGGQTWSYVTGNYVEKVLNYTFGWNWDFEVVNHGKEQDMVWVLGKLTVKDDKGHTITKSQFGRADIKFKKDTKIMLDYGNDLKSATTDSLKKCASLLGIASDVYGKTEIKQETGREVVEVAQSTQTQPNTPIAQNLGNTEVFEDHVCVYKGCGRDITKQEAEYSKKLYGKEYCREHQNIIKQSKN